MGGAFRPQWRESPAIVLRLSLPCCPKRSRIDAKHGDHFLQADLDLDFWGTSGPIERTLLGFETRGIFTRLQMLEDASVIPTYRITFQRDT